MFSGFCRQSSEEFYDLLTCKLVELLCQQILSVPAMRQALLIAVNSVAVPTTRGENHSSSTTLSEQHT